MSQDKPRRPSPKPVIGIEGGSRMGKMITVAELEATIAQQARDIQFLRRSEAALNLKLAAKNRQIARLESELRKLQDELMYYEGIKG